MRKAGVLLVIVLLLAMVPAALAGGWASVTLDEPPGEIRAGEAWVVGLTVLQHGMTPVHNLGEGVPVEPTFVATNAATGERVEAVARPDKEIGHFTLEVMLPSEGEWEWTIYPAPLAGDEQMRSLMVLPPAPAADTSATLLSTSGYALTRGLFWAALAVVALSVALFIVQGRRRSAVKVSGER
jgi:hypothetical protein